ncbi:MAG: cyclopropane fatty acyl phospholipid synthase [Nitrospirae bacterium]|nr:cyclopropane fatty acyl phospholipid synthase [Nitrospirota bacterium]
MGVCSLKCSIKDIFSAAGININGTNPFDIRINDARFYKQVTRDGSLGLGESYIEGCWDCESLDGFFYRLMASDAEDKVKKNWGLIIRSVICNVNNRSRAFQIGERHYDMGNELYQNMLDKRMTYSCGYWETAKNLDEAQEAKMDLICRKLSLQPGDRILDIGCGWGSFVKYASEKYGVKAVGITVSRNQAVFAKEMCAGLPVEIRLQDYRELDEKFDHIVSVGMFEHVGYKNYRTYMETAGKCLEDGGLFLLHTIGESCSKVAFEPWVDKYIFPNSLIPSVRQISAAIEKIFVIEDLHNFGFHYYPTLVSWFNNFNRNWDVLKEHYNDRFYRMWKYYLLSCAGTFRARCLQVWQIVLSKKGVPGGYSHVR